MDKQEGKGQPTYNKKREGYLDWSHLAGELPSETCYWRKDIKDRKMRKKT